MKQLTNNMKNGILSLTEKRLQLKQHPPRNNADQSTITGSTEVLLPNKPDLVHPIKFTSTEMQKVL